MLRGCQIKQDNAVLNWTVDRGSNAFEAKDMIDEILPVIREAVK